MFERKLKGNGSGMVHAGWWVVGGGGEAVEDERKKSWGRPSYEHICDTTLEQPRLSHRCGFIVKYRRLRVCPLTAAWTVISFPVCLSRRPQSHHSSSSPQHRPHVLQYHHHPNSAWYLHPTCPARAPLCSSPALQPQAPPANLLSGRQAEHGIASAPRSIESSVCNSPSTGPCQPVPAQSKPVLSLARISDASKPKQPPSPNALVAYNHSHHRSQIPSLKQAEARFHIALHRIRPSLPPPLHSKPGLSHLHLHENRRTSSRRADIQRVGTTLATKRPKGFASRVPGLLSFAAICSPVEIFTQSEGPPTLSHRPPTPHAHVPANQLKLHPSPSLARGTNHSTFFILSPPSTFLSSPPFLYTEDRLVRTPIARFFRVGVFKAATSRANSRDRKTKVELRLRSRRD
ncbi:uncharacterized protein PAC_00131 [Phialocephala subalpina]|uniref:Uncharacterized protein n=1 Tax=Phialocephala subalpina TaxID=576137 RepID=A0A1L7WC78_9HELO|nr:uncharacterized protein PAC_00131 [Phialocephala subalpina]